MSPGSGDGQKMRVALAVNRAGQFDPLVLVEIVEAKCHEG
jgi:hypothetical protein